MQIDEPVLQQIAIDLCQSMLGLELEPIPATVFEPAQLVASVEIHGDQNMIVEVLAHENLLASIAEVMFATDRSSLTGDEIRDAFCEIANIIGGNVKGSLGGESSLSLPKFRMAEECDADLFHDGLQTSFLCCGQPMSIILRAVVRETDAERLSVNV